MTARSQAEDVAVVLAAAEAKRALRPATDRDPIVREHGARHVAGGAE